MENLLVSACLVGLNCKYNGGNNYNSKILELMKKYNFILICPEYDGGLPIPRKPSEIKNGVVINSSFEDVTINFNAGAKKALELAKIYNCKKALLKEKSPSCGKNYTYDGTFSNKLIERSGISAKLLIDNNIKEYSENEIDKLL